MRPPLPVISEWDPRSTAVGSIDPMGALRAYNTIANFLLPGVTTVTTRVRYLSWVCAGLYVLDEIGDAPEGGQAGRARRQRLLAWERLVALATGHFATSHELASDDPAWRGLRGISYVHKAVRENRLSPAYPLLKNQSNVGGVGTYWVTLVKGGLVDDAPGSLTQRGADLAEAFLSASETPPRNRLKRVLTGKDVRFDDSMLASWGRRASLNTGVATRKECDRLRDALLTPLQHRCMLAALPASPRSDRPTFKRLIRELKRSTDPVARAMSAVCALTIEFESLHAALLDVFDRLRALYEHGAPVVFAKAVAVCGDLDVIRGRALSLGRTLDGLTDAPPEVTSRVTEFLRAVRPIAEAGDAGKLVKQLCRHHERVQAGKLDGARQPKQPWISLLDRGLVVAPRFALDGVPLPRSTDAFTHPYRLEAFSGMLGEVGALERTE